MFRDQEWCPEIHISDCVKLILNTGRILLFKGFYNEHVLFTKVRKMVSIWKKNQAPDFLQVLPPVRLGLSLWLC